MHVIKRTDDGRYAAIPKERYRSVKWHLDINKARVYTRRSDATCSMKANANFRLKDTITKIVQVTLAEVSDARS